MLLFLSYLVPKFSSNFPLHCWETPQSGPTWDLSVGQVWREAAGGQYVKVVGLQSELPVKNVIVICLFVKIKWVFVLNIVTFNI